MPTYVDWLYDIAFPARVDVTHRAQHLISSLLHPSLRKTSFGPDKCQLVNYSMLTKVLHKYNRKLLAGNEE
jgi:hypothetical protein